MRVLRRSFEVVLALTLLSNSDVGGATLLKSDADKAREKCAANGKLTAQGLVRTRGIFVDGPDLADPMLRAAKLLGEQRLSFVEFKRRPASPQTMPKSARWYYLDFSEDLLGPERDEPYVRLSIAPISDARCAPFKRIISSRRYSAMSYRWSGLSPDLCVAVERVVQLNAPIERVFIRDDAKSKTDFGGSFVLRDRANGQKHAEVWTDGGRYCKNEDEYRGLDKLVVGPGSPLLGPLPQVIEVRDVEFPARDRMRIAGLGPEIPDPTTSSEWQARFESRPSRTGEIEAYGQLIDNAQTSLEPYYERHSIPGLSGVGTNLAGYQLYIVRPGLRKRVRLVDGSSVYNDCFRLRREGRLLVVECRSFRPSGELGKGAWGAWVLTFLDDGSPFRIFSIDLGRTDGSAQAFEVQLRDGVPGSALLNINQKTDSGIRRTFHRATLEPQ